MPRRDLGAQDSKLRKPNPSPLRIYILVQKYRQQTHEEILLMMSAITKKSRKALSEVTCKWRPEGSTVMILVNI